MVGPFQSYKGSAGMLVVTGAAGFIGSNIVAALNAAGRRDVVAADNPQAPEQTSNLTDLHVQSFVPKDELAAWLSSHAGAVDGVIHMGACSDTTQTDRAFMLRNNLEYTRTLWNFCAQRQVRFVYASSAATYGDGSAGYDDAADARGLKPLNLYGESKHLFDLWALEQTQTPPGWAGLKFFNVYGPRERHKGRMASVAFHAFQQIRAGGRVKLFKSGRPEIPDGGQQRDFVYVRDTAAAALHCLRAPAEAVRGLYNVGTGRARTFADLVTAVFRAMNLEPRIDYIPMPADLEGRYQYFTEAKIARLRACGFAAPFHSVEEGVADYVRNHLLAEGRRDGVSKVPRL